MPEKVILLVKYRKGASLQPLLKLHLNRSISRAIIGSIPGVLEGDVNSELTDMVYEASLETLSNA